MLNRNYQRGVRFERQRMELHKKRGAKVIWRTAGSHSALDVGAIYKRKRAESPGAFGDGIIILGKIVFEQCKVTSITKKKKHRMPNPTKKKIKLPKTGFYWVTFELQTKVIAKRKWSKKK